MKETFPFPGTNELFFIIVMKYNLSAFSPQSEKYTLK